ncbi:MAG: type II toxin-antitoxin system PemK/MazF family toxin [Streptosporangiaceae bacterium]
MRGDLFRVKAARGAVGDEQHGGRFAAVVQSDFVQPSTLLVAPTSTSAKWAQYRPEIEVDGTATRVLIEQTMTVDPQRLGEFAGRLDAQEMSAVDDALKLVYALG